MASQSYAQITFAESTPYRLRTAIVAQEDYDLGKVSPNSGVYAYPTACTCKNALDLHAKETSGDTQLITFEPVSGVTFEYPAASGEVYQVYNVVTANSLTGTGNGKGALERNNLSSNGHRMRANGNPQTNGNLFNVILVSNPITSDATFGTIANGVSIVSVYGTDSSPSSYRRYVATNNYDALNFGSVPNPATTPYTDIWVLETAAGAEVTEIPAPTLSNKEFDVSSIFISNPVQNELSVKGLTSNVKEISVYSLIGSLVLQSKVNGESSVKFDISLISSGMYIVKLAGDNVSFSKKIIKN